MTEPRLERFVIVCNSRERRMISELAEKLNWSQGDAVRTVVREAVKVLRTQDKQHARDGRPTN